MLWVSCRVIRLLWGLRVPLRFRHGPRAVVTRLSRSGTPAFSTLPRTQIGARNELFKDSCCRSRLALRSVARPREPSWSFGRHAGSRSGRRRLGCCVSAARSFACGREAAAADALGAMPVRSTPRATRGSRFETDAGPKTGRLGAFQDTATGSPDMAAIPRRVATQSGSGREEQSSRWRGQHAICGPVLFERPPWSRSQNPPRSGKPGLAPRGHRSPAIAFASRNTRSCTPSSGNDSSRSSPQPESARPTAAACGRSSSATCAAISTAASSPADSSASAARTAASKGS